MFRAWLHGGEDPWRLYNMLDEDYRPVSKSDAPSVRPLHPTRLKAFLYACAEVAATTREAGG